MKNPFDSETKANKNMFGLKKEDIIKDLSGLKKRNKSFKIRIKNIMIMKILNTKKKDMYDDIDEDYYNPIRIGNVFSSNYIEYESNRDKDKTLSIKDYINKIKPHLSDIINDPKTEGEWKIQLIIAINFFSSKNSQETRTKHSDNDNIETMIGGETDEIVKKPFESYKDIKKN